MRSSSNIAKPACALCDPLNAWGKDSPVGAIREAVVCIYFPCTSGCVNVLGETRPVGTLI
eukprot:2429706-Prorocentrum_lima.AAC.1